MKKINIIQFLPYYPPHKGGLETHALEWGKWWVKNNLGKVYNIITDFNQEEEFEKNEKIIFENEIIGYKKDGVEILVVPSFEIINNFPVYKIWDKKYKLIIKYLEGKNSPYLASPKGRGIEQNWIAITRTRFFLTSLIGGIFARKYKKNWIHIEHGSDYVKLSSRFKTFIAYVYDRIFGKWIFKKADVLVGVSNACRKFIREEFVNRNIEVIYRGVELKEKNIDKKGKLKLVFIGRLVKLKGLEDLLEAYEKLNIDIDLDIIGDGEEFRRLKKIVSRKKLKNVDFLGFKNKLFISKYLSHNKCILVNPSYQEGLPTTVIEALFYKNVAIASNVGGTSEISDKKDLILFEAGNIDKLVKNIELAIEKHGELAGLSKKIIEKKFSWEKNILKYYKLLNEE